MMKRILIVLGSVWLVSIMVSVLFSNTWTLIMAVSLSVVLILLSVFFAGVYVARDMMSHGADIVLRGQEINDKYDAMKAQSYLR